MKLNINEIDKILESDLPSQQKIAKTRERVNSAPMEESDSNKKDSYTKKKNRKR